MPGVVHKFNAVMTLVGLVLRVGVLNPNGLNQSINLSINQSVSQSINQSINQSIS